MIFRIRIVSCFVSSCLLVCANAQQPKVWVMDAQRLAGIKQKYLHNDPTMLRLVNNITKEADKLLTAKPLSVMDKGFTPVSGSKHDYMSQAPYFWYDSSKPNGLPYLRKDGERNPEINKIEDHKNLGDLDYASRILSLSWYFTGQEKYAQKAAMLLRCWFLDADTKMNPNLDYGQAIPGVTTGRGIGIIETNSLTGIADAVGLLKGSQVWTPVDDKGIHDWYKQFLNWMLTSKNGGEEHAAKNNHGTWYYSQVVDYALFTGDLSKAHELAEESKKLIDGQIDAEGKMALELERTNALGYSTYNLEAWFKLALLAEKAGTDLFNYTNPKGAGIRTAVNWLQPYSTGEKKFTYQQIGGYNKNEMYEVLLQAAKKYNEPAYLVAAKKTEQQDKNLMTELMYGGQ